MNRIERIIKENQKRQARLDEPYDPATGEGSHIERVLVEWTDERRVWLPKSMLRHNPGLQDLARPGGLPKMWRDHWQGFESWEKCQARMAGWRLDYDFELWSATCAEIKLDAETRQATGLARGNLVLNRAQRIYLDTLQSLFFSGVPVRIILLKARQWGGSTLTQLFMSWVQQRHRTGWNIFIVALTITQASHIRAMYDIMREGLPWQLGRLTFGNYQGMSNIKYIPELDAILGVTSIERPDSARSFTIHMAHLSEVGLWPSTVKVNAADTAQSITGAVPEEPMTIIVEESTAKGVGTYFHKHWQSATARPARTTYKPVFVSWLEIPKYRKDVEDLAAFARQYLKGTETGEPSMEMGLWKAGASLEQIAWYQNKLKGFKGRIEKMQSEFPTTPEEAFQSTGSRYFSIDAINQARASTRPPAKVGRLIGKERTGKLALQDLKFIPGDEGPISVWHEPGHQWRLHEVGTTYSHRYCGYADFGGKRPEADWSVLTVLDRAPMCWAGVPVVAASVVCHLRPDLFAWLCAQVMQWYDQGLLAYEINRMRRDSGDEERGFEPEWSLAALDEVSGVYPNLYFRKDIEAADEHLQGLKLGFHLNQSTKPLIVNTLDAALDDQGYVERDERALHELLSFEEKPDGTLGAVQGNHDDIVISRAGSLWLALKHMPPCKVIRKGEYQRPRHAGAASF